jgi:hypothetical protein
MHARFYNPTASRFLSVDPIIPTGAMRNPQMWNRYSYVANNPMNRTDPDGKVLQIAGCSDTKSETCQKNYNLYLSTFGNQSQQAAKYLQLGKNGIVSFNGISGAAFGTKFGTMGRASNFLISNRSATFSISTDASRVDHSGGNYATTRYGNVGMSKDTNTVYKFIVGRIDAPTGFMKTEQANGRTLPIVFAQNENKSGKLDQPNVNMTINADFVESSYRNVQSMTVPAMARALFEEASHGLDIGSGTKSAKEAWDAEPMFNAGTEPRMQQFERELKDILPPPDGN